MELIIRITEPCFSVRHCWLSRPEIRENVGIAVGKVSNDLTNGRTDQEY